MQVAAAGKQVVERQTDAPLPGGHPAAAIERNEERQRMHEMGGVVEQKTAVRASAS